MDERLWRDRFQTYLKETGKYLRYIFNGHLVFVLIILLGGAGFYYSEWVKTLTPDFPSAWIMAVLLGLIITASPLSTFFRDPDIVFLLPLETKLATYVRKSWVYSMVMQGYWLILILAVLMPMYIQTRGEQAVSFIGLLIALLLLKGINLIVRWFALYFRDKTTALMDGAIRLFTNVVFIYFLAAQASVIFMLVPVLVLLLLLGYYYRASRTLGMNWEKLIELENGRMSSFYRIANLFTDVPKMKEKTSERRWLNGLLPLFPGIKMNLFSFLYARTFLRANDYLGLFVRLSIIAILIFLFADLTMGSVFLSVLFLYMTGLQLLPIWHHHDHKMMIDLYPVQQAKRVKAVLDLLSFILAVQNGLFTVAILVGSGLPTALITLACGSILIVLFRMYAKNKMYKAS